MLHHENSSNGTAVPFPGLAAPAGSEAVLRVATGPAFDHLAGSQAGPSCPPGSRARVRE
jgi:hypothetical protein